jgi:surface polysaccharide O-acyltransferase-like enzyme
METTKQSHKDIPWIHLLRVLACLMVISVHCQTAAGNFTVDELTRHFDMLVTAATKPCVPLFFMITGYLILPYRNGDDVKTFYKKRIPRVLFPLLVWGAVYAVLPYILDMCSITEMWKELVLSPIKAPTYIGGIMWYLFILIGIYLAIPFLTERIYTNRKMLELWLAIWFVTSIVFMIKLFVPDILGQNKYVDNFDLTVYFCGYMGYVMVGYYLSQYVPNIGGGGS